MMLSPALSKALTLGERYRNGSKRTPRTLTRLMQQHRESERHRHHGLNASIRELSKTIPGYEDSSKETKIFKLQRVINYICHLEGHIQDLCEDLGMGLDFKNLFLSPHVTSADGCTKRSRSSCDLDGLPTQVPLTEDYSYEEKASPGELSFPTYPFVYMEDSNSSSQPPTTSTSGSSSDDWQPSAPTDVDALTLSALLTVDSKDLCHVRSTDSQEVAQTEDDNMVSASEQVFFQDFVQTPSASQDQIEWTSIEPAKVEIPCSPETIWPDTFNTSRQNTTKYVIDVNPIGSSRQLSSCDGMSPAISEESMDELSKRGQKRKGLLQEDERQLSPSSRKRPRTFDFGQEVCVEKQYHEVYTCTPETSPAITPINIRPTVSPINIKPIVKNKEKVSSISRQGRIDHRKTSWMNGFMMYSRIHRRKYIDDNPGVHTSYISKMMGQDWRKLQPEEQKPYKEKAKAYIEHHLRPRTRSFEELGQALPQVSVE